MDSHRTVADARRVWEICLTHDPALGGLHRSIEDFAKALDANILSFDDSRANRAQIDSAGRIHRLRCSPQWLNRECLFITPGMKREADRIAANAKALMVHSLFRDHAAWAMDFADRNGIRYGVAVHGSLDPVGMRRRPALKRLWMRLKGQAFLERATAVFFATTREMQQAMQWATACRPVVVHWPVVVPDVFRHDDARASFRTRHGIPQEARLLLFVGRLHSIKRLFHLIDVFAAAESPNCRLAIVGMDGDVRSASLQRHAASLRCDRIHVLGPLQGENLEAAYLGSDGYMSLSYRENFSYSMADALAYGLPVIVSPGHYLAHDLPRTSRDGFRCGWLLGDDSPSSAVHAVEQFATASTAVLDDMGGHGRAWAIENLSWATFAATVRNALC